MSVFAVDFVPDLQRVRVCHLVAWNEARDRAAEEGDRAHKRSEQKKVDRCTYARSPPRVHAFGGRPRQAGFLDCGARLSSCKSGAADVAALTLVLHVPSRVVDRESVACHVAHGVGCFDVPSTLANDNAELDYRVKTRVSPVLSRVDSRLTRSRGALRRPSALRRPPRRRRTASSHTVRCTLAYSVTNTRAHACRRLEEEEWLGRR